MTMSGFSLCALRVHFLLITLVTYIGLTPFGKTTTTTKTLTSTTTVLTSTVTITTGGTTYKTLTTATSIETIPKPSMAIGSGHGSYGGLEFKSAVLNSTNYFRTQYQAHALSWDPTLAEYAQKHAEKCIWRHSGGPYGENLAEGFKTPTLAIDAWAAEEDKYNYGKDQFTEASGHFTQLVWKNTRKVGCGAVNCTSNAENAAFGYFMVCEYDPPGNVEGAFGRNVGKPGEGSNGKPGFGAASRISGASRLLVALVAVSSLAVMCL